MRMRISKSVFRGSPTMGRSGRRRKSEELPGGDIKKTVLVKQEVTKSRYVSPEYILPHFISVSVKSKEVEIKRGLLL